MISQKISLFLFSIFTITVFTSHVDAVELKTLTSFEILNQDLANFKSNDELDIVVALKNYHGHDVKRTAIIESVIIEGELLSMDAFFTLDYKGITLDYQEISTWGKSDKRISVTVNNEDERKLGSLDEGDWLVKVDRASQSNPLFKPNKVIININGL